jgi:hypothetical protein
MHAAVFRRWLSMPLEQQSRDLTAYLSTSEGRAAFLSFDLRELGSILTPAEAQPPERELFHSDLASLLQSLSQRHQTDAAQPARIERIA